jgi:hypothetical protein
MRDRLLAAAESGQRNAEAVMRQGGIGTAAKRLPDHLAGLIELVLASPDEAEVIERVEIVMIELEDGAIDLLALAQLALAAQLRRLLDQLSRVEGRRRPVWQGVA